MQKDYNMRNKKRYAVVIDTYVYADNDYMARKMAHNIRRSINGDFTRVLEIDECPYASIETRPLDDLSEPAIKETELPF